jgi:cell division protein FtsN
MAKKKKTKKQKVIAEREVQKLIDKGYPAFIYKIYIPKFDGTWHRVRLGPYKSLSQAKSVQEKLK